MKMRHKNRACENRSLNSAKIAALLVCAAAGPALASTVAQVEAQASGSTAALTNNPVITYIASQAGATVDGYGPYSSWSFLVNDGTGSLDVFGKLPAGSTYTPTVGDAINVTGTYSPFDGIPEVASVSAISQVSSGNAVAGPLTVTIPQLNAAATTPNYNLSEYLVTVKDVQLSGLTTFATHANNTLYATDSSGNNLTIFQWASSYSAAAVFGGQSVPTGYQDITGIFDVFDGAPEFIPFGITPSAGPPPPPPNNSTLTITSQASQPAGSTVQVTDSKTATATVGNLVNLGSNGVGGADGPNMQRVMLLGGSTTTTIQLTANNGPSETGDTTTYAAATGTNITAHGGATGANNPLPAGQTDIATVGYNTIDTPSGSAGKMTNGGANGLLQFVNLNNSNDAPINVTLNPVKILAARNLTAGTSTTGAKDVNSGAPMSVLVGQTGTATVQLSTVNTTTNNDFSSNAVTNVALLANAQATPFTQDDAFNTSKAVGIISAVAPNYTQVFGGEHQGVNGAYNNVGTDAVPLPGSTPLPGEVTMQIKDLVSGSYGDSHTETVGGTTKNYSPNFSQFEGAADGVVGMGLPTENEAIWVYGLYTGFQAASVTGNSSPVGNGGTATLTNAPTNDNIVTVGTSSQNFGLRDEAWITSTTFNQDGWSQSGFNNATPNGSGGDNPGTVISGSSGYGDGNSYSQSATLSYNPSLALAGSYTGGSMVVGLENGEQDNTINGGAIQGATHNDLAPVLVPVANETGTGDGSGSYNFGGGTFIASGVTHLTGSYSQSGGSATFTQITGNGAVTITGGTAKLATGHHASTVSTLNISGTGLLDITDNLLTVNTASVSGITALIAQAYDKGKWDGATGITSSTAAATPGTAIGVNVNGAGANVMFTWYGDTDLSGTVTSTDLSNIKPGMANPTWANGDFNYDGVVNADDIGLAMLGAADSNGRSIGNVAPEPAAVSALLLPAIFATRRRRRS